MKIGENEEFTFEPKNLTIQERKSGTLRVQFSPKTVKCGTNSR